MEFPHPHTLFDFRGKVAVVTGASVGIGAGIARRFAQAGAQVALTYRSHPQQAEQVLARIRKEGGNARGYALDVSRGSEVSAFFEQVRSDLGPVAILVNNAGIYPKADLLDMTEGEWDETLAVDLKSVFLCTQAAARQMVAAGIPGSIVNIGSIEGVNPASGHSHYAAAKAGVAMFSMNAALELGRHGIRVNTVSPGLINAPALSSNWPDGVARWLKRCPLGRLGEPEDIADACLFFASDASRWISGTQLLADGGVMTSQIY